jgi:V8-like Glu-specific endopeptidase
MLVKSKMIWVLILLILLPTSNINAQTTKQEIKISIPKFNITMNGKKIDNALEKYPLVVYKNITYFPMTWYYAQQLGIQIDWNPLQGLSIQKGNSTLIKSLPEKKVQTLSNENLVATLPIFNIYVNGRLIDNQLEEYPVIIFRDITYFPMTWKFAVEEFNLRTSFDLENGFTLSSSNPSDISSSSSPSQSIEASTIKSLLSSEDIYQKMNPGVVFIEAFAENGSLIGSGSGIIVGENGTVLTNYHVIVNSSRPSYVSIKLTNGQVYKAYKVLAYDKIRDIAVLKIDSVEKLPALELGNSEEIKVGQNIFTIGYPLGVGSVMSTGIISSAKTTVEDKEFIQISAPISPGSSGGALINAYGAVIGITTATLTEGQNMNLAVPINAFKMMPLSKEILLSQIIDNATSESTSSESKETAQVYELEPNNEKERATLVNGSEFIIQGHSDTQSDADYFKFTVSKFAKVTLIGVYESDELTSELEISLTDEKGYINWYSKKKISESDGEVYQELLAILLPGTYYVKVCPSKNLLNQELFKTFKQYKIYGLL